jgi:hypothetical protein
MYRHPRRTRLLQVEDLHLCTEPSAAGEETSVNGWSGE